MLTGECFCGAVTYQIDGDLDMMYCCYCSRCRKLTSSSYATIGATNAELFNINDGEDSVEQVEHIPPPTQRYHCEKCHTWLYADSEDYPGVKFIACGTLNEMPEKSLDYHIHVDSRASWVTINDGLPQYPGARPK